jgi:[acyl-carrier-protein] S-malonyltransferase
MPAPAQWGTGVASSTVSTAFTFPGQGSQVVGMGKELADRFPEARAVFAEVDDALGEKLSHLIFEGPDEALRLTENAQPALMAVSIAVLRVLEARGMLLADTASYVAGHSLGEYSALCAAGTFTLTDAARLLRIRGRAMQQAVPVGKGAMAAILGVEMAALRDICALSAQGQVCDIANDNAPGQIVISGDLAAVERAMDLAKEKGAKRALPLPVSAPFHCRLMLPAAEAMQQALAETAMQAPVVPLVANVTARPVSDPNDIRRHLVAQVTGMVRWTESVGWLAQDAGVARLVELGAGKVLSGLARRIAPSAETVSIGTPADVDAFTAAATEN